MALRGWNGGGGEGAWGQLVWGDGVAREGDKDEAGELLTCCPECLCMCVWGGEEGR